MDTHIARRQAIIKTFGLSERFLFALSKDPDDVFQAGSWAKPTQQWSLETALSDLIAQFPNLLSLIRGKRVLDYGCGDGFQSVALADAGAAEVMGVDIALPRLEHGRRLAGNRKNVLFGPRAEGHFDLAISLNSFEHFPEPEKNLRDLADAVRSGGKILITFGPPWLAPYGSHMNFFTHFPWVNVLFAERTVFHVRKLYRDDNASSYLPGINKMTIARFERIIAISGLTIEQLSYHGVKGLSVLTKIPFLREFFTNGVACVLTKPIEQR